MILAKVRQVESQIKTTKSNQKTQQVSLLVIGNRGVGKSTSLCAMYAQSQENQQWKLIASDRTTQNTIVSQVEKYIATTGAYPTPTMKSDKFNFWVKLRTWWGWDNVAQLSLQDLPGEWCQFNNALFVGELLLSDGCLVYLNGEEIFGVEHTEQLEEILQPVKKLAQILKDRKLAKKVAIIITKSDRFFERFDYQEYYDENNIFNRAKRRLKEILSNSSSFSYQIDYRIFESATTIASDGERFVLKNSSCLNTLAWLGQFQSLKASAFPKRLSKKMLVALAICSLSVLSGVFGFKLLSSIQFVQPTQPTWQK